mgnify:CR=1 FL=1
MLYSFQIFLILYQIYFDGWKFESDSSSLIHWFQCICPPEGRFQCQFLNFCPEAAAVVLNVTPIEGHGQIPLAATRGTTEPTLRKVQFNQNNNDNYDDIIMTSLFFIGFWDVKGKNNLAIWVPSCVIPSTSTSGIFLGNMRSIICLISNILWKH